MRICTCDAVSSVCFCARPAPRELALLLRRHRCGRTSPPASIDNCRCRKLLSSVSILRPHLGGVGLPISTSTHSMSNWQNLACSSALASFWIRVALGAAARDRLLVGDVAEEGAEHRVQRLVISFLHVARSAG